MPLPLLNQPPSVVPWHLLPPKQTRRQVTPAWGYDCHRWTVAMPSHPSAHWHWHWYWFEPGSRSRSRSRSRAMLLAHVQNAKRVVLALEVHFLPLSLPPAPVCVPIPFEVPVPVPVLVPCLGEWARGHLSDVFPRACGSGAAHHQCLRLVGRLAPPT